MSEWRETTLGEIADLLVGFAFKSSRFSGDSEAIRLLRGVNIGQGNLDWERCAYWPLSEQRDARYELRTGDVVLAMDRPWIEAGLKRSRVREKDLPALLVQRVTRLRGTAHVLTSYIHHLLATETFSRYLQAIVTGATVPHISQAQIAAFQFDLPPLKYQQRMCATLDALDELIENNRKRIELLEQMAHAIYREWFVCFRFPGHENDALVDSVLGPIPGGWRAVTVDQLVRIVTTTVDPSTLEPATPAVGLEHIPRRQLTLADWGTANQLGSRKSLFEVGDVLFGKIRPYFHKVSVAPIDGICSTDAIVIRPRPDYWGVAVLTIASDDFVANATQTSNGTKMPRADWKVIKYFPIVVPPVALARHFTEIVKDALGAAQRLMLANRELAAMRDLLLPRLVTGQIDVSNLELGTLTDAMA